MDQGACSRIGQFSRVSAHTSADFEYKNDFYRIINCGSHLQYTGVHYGVLKWMGVHGAACGRTLTVTETMRRTLTRRHARA